MSEVSATLVAKTIRLALCGLNIFCWSSMLNRANNGNTSMCFNLAERPWYFLKCSATSRISRSPGKNTKISPSRPSSVFRRNKSSAASIIASSMASSSSSSSSHLASVLAFREMPKIESSSKSNCAFSACAVSFARKPALPSGL